MPIAAGHKYRGKSTFHTLGRVEDAPAELILKKFDAMEVETYLTFKALENDPILEFLPQFHGCLRASAPGEEDDEFMVLSNCLREFREPHVMDVKLGVRTFLEAEVENPVLRPDLYNRMLKAFPDQLTERERNAEGITKLRWLSMRDTWSTSRELGYRVEGSIIAPRHDGQEAIQTKSREEIRTHKDAVEALRIFAEDDKDIAAALCSRLEEFREALENSPFVEDHELIGTSVLLIVDEDGRRGVFWLDFAKTRRLPQDVLPGHRNSWELGNHADGLLTGVDNLIQALSELADSAPSRNACSRTSCASTHSGPGDSSSASED